VKGEIPKWFSDRVKQGLGAITVLSLPGTPFDDMRKTSEVWMMALWTAQHWNAELDAARLDAAFLSVARRAERWPAAGAADAAYLGAPVAHAGATRDEPPSRTGVGRDAVEQAHGAAQRARARLLPRVLIIAPACR
jgi:hypothetical protein